MEADKRSSPTSGADLGKDATRLDSSQIAPASGESVAAGKVRINVERLRRERRRAGLSQAALAHEARLSISTIKRAEACHPVNLGTVRELAQFFEINVECLLDLPAQDAQPVPRGPQPEERPHGISGCQAVVTRCQPAEAARDNREVTLVLGGPCPGQHASCDFDPEALRSLVLLVERFGGRLHAAPSGGFVAIFGLEPIAGASATRALHCALALAAAWQPAVARGSAELRLIVGEGKQRAGAAVPEGVMSLQTAGDRRLGGGVFVAARVRDAAHDVFEFAALATSAPRARQLWRLVGPRGRRASLSLVGREPELQQFASALDDCKRFERGRLFCVRGSAGIGKSRLIEEFAVLARRAGFACHTAHVLDFGRANERDVFGSLAQGLIDDAADRVSPEASCGAAWTPEEWAHINLMLGNVSTGQLERVLHASDPETRRAMTQQVFANLVARQARCRPLLLCIEDLHWADAALKDDIQALASHLPELAVVLVLTSRVDPDPFDGVWRARTRATPTSTIDLVPLSQEAALALARERCDDAALVARCVKRAAGHPLFLDQLLRCGMGDDAQLPYSVSSLIQARLDQLPAIEAQALRAASVIGQWFSLQLLRALTGRDDHSPEELERRHLVCRDGSRYRFCHALIHEGVYATLGQDERKQLHLACARWFDGRDTALVARHLGRAGDAGATSAYLTAAAELASRCLYGEALELLAEGLSGEPSAEGRSELHLLAGQLAGQLGRGRESLEHLDRVIELTSDAARRCEAQLALAAAYNLLDQPERAGHVLDAAQGTAQALDLTLALAQLHYLRGNLLFPTGKVDACRAEHELALEYAKRAGSAEGEARALSGLGDAAYADGRMREAFQHFQSCLERCERFGLVRVEAANRFMLGTVRIYQNQTRRALDEALGSAELAVQAGQVRAEIVSRLTAAWVHLSLCQVASAEAEVLRGLEVAHQSRAARFVTFLLESLARVRLAQGRAEEASQVLQSAAEGVVTHGLERFIGPWVMGSVALASRDVHAAQQALRSGDELIERGAVGHNYYRYFPAAAIVALRAGWLDRAAAYTERLHGYTRRSPTPWASLHVQSLRALLALARRPSCVDHQRGVSLLVRRLRDAELLAEAHLFEQTAAELSPK